jgi:hypothetical protein
MPRSVLAAATRKQARYTLRAISLRKLPSNGNVDGFIQRWWLVAKIMMGERAPARRIPSAAAVTGNLDQIVSPAAASTTSPICS